MEMVSVLSILYAYLSIYVVLATEVVWDFDRFLVHLPGENRSEVPNTGLAAPPPKSWTKVSLQDSSVSPYPVPLREEVTAVFFDKNVGETQCHKPSPSHEDFYRWYCYHSLMGGYSCFTHISVLCPNNTSTTQNIKTDWWSSSHAPLIQCNLTDI